MHRTPPLSCSAEEIEEHLQSIDRVPPAILPADSVARSALVMLAAAGRDVYAYASGGETYGTWVAWLGDLADVRPDHDGRVTLAEWVTSWRTLLDSMLPAVFADADPEGGAA
jgi:hypothetical protein